MSITPKHSILNWNILLSNSKLKVLRLLGSIHTVPKEIVNHPTNVVEESYVFSENYPEFTNHIFLKCAKDTIISIYKGVSLLEGYFEILNYKVYIFRCSPKYIEDRENILKGNFSKISDKAKQLIIEQLENRYAPGKVDSFINRLLRPNEKDLVELKKELNLHEDYELTELCSVFNNDNLIMKKEEQVISFIRHLQLT